MELVVAGTTVRYGLDSRHLDFDDGLKPESFASILRALMDNGIGFSLLDPDFPSPASSGVCLRYSSVNGSWNMTVRDPAWTGGSHDIRPPVVARQMFDLYASGRLHSLELHGRGSDTPDAPSSEEDNDRMNRLLEEIHVRGPKAAVQHVVVWGGAERCGVMSFSVSGTTVRSERGNQHLVFDAGLKPETFASVVQAMMDKGMEFSFHDPKFPSPTDPGAYLDYSPRIGGWRMTLGNHGWRGGMYDVPSATVAKQLFDLYDSGHLHSLKLNGGCFFRQETAVSEEDNGKMNRLLDELHGPKNGVAPEAHSPSDPHVARGFLRRIWRSLHR